MRALLVSTILLCAPGCGDDGRPPVRDAGGGSVDAGTADGGDSGTPDTCNNGMRDGDETARDCGGSCSPCADGEGCARPTDCLSMVCVGGFCLMPACDDGVLNGAEVDIDCGGGTCDGCGAGAMCGANEDCASLVCMGGACLDSSCTSGVMDADETDVDCGGSCPPCGPGLMCAMDEDCASSICMGGACTTPICTDRVMNGAETDVDCGGTDCPPCADRMMCAMGTDCTGGVCQAGTCVSCMDGVINQDETDVDCGGATCTGCDPMLMCGAGTDCTSGVCTMGTCAAPDCTDMVMNGMESDVDCGGPTCMGCAMGAMCTTGPDCADGVCGMGMTCSAPTCTDGVRNGTETDVDCGGPGACPRCADLRRCMAPSDCMTAMCTMGFCGPLGVLTLYSCSNGDGNLRVLDPTTGRTMSMVPITIGGTAIRGCNGLAADPLTLTLYSVIRRTGMMASGRELATIDQMTGVATPIGMLPPGLASLAFDAAGTLYGVTGDGGTPSETLFTINTMSAAMTMVRPLGAGNDGESIAFNPSEPTRLYHLSGIGGGRIMEWINLSMPMAPPTTVTLGGFAYSEALDFVWDRTRGIFVGSDLGDRFYSLTTTGTATMLGPLDHTSKGLAFAP